MFYEIDILLISSLLLKMALYVLGYWGGGGGAFIFSSPEPKAPR